MQTVVIRKLQMAHAKNFLTFFDISDSFKTGKLEWVTWL